MNRYKLLCVLSLLAGFTLCAAVAASKVTKSASNLFARAESEQKAGHLEAALAGFDQAIKLSPDFVEAYINRAVVKAALRDFDGAIRDSDRAIHLKSNCAPAFNNRGMAKLDKKDVAGAIADVKLAIFHDPLFATAFINLGAIKFRQGDLDAAISAFTEARQISPELAVAYRYRGLVLYQKGDFDAALADFDRAIELKVEDPQVFRFRGIMRRRNRDFSGAIADFDRAVRLVPNDRGSLYARAVARIATGDFAQAIGDLEKRIALKPEDAAYARFARHIVLRRLARTAEDDLGSQVESWPESWQKTVGRFLMGNAPLGVLVDSIGESNTAKERSERSCEVYYYAAVVDLLEGRVSEARRKFEMCLASRATGLAEFELAQAELARLEVLD